MTKGATVVVANDDRGRHGTVLEEVAARVVSGLGGEREVTKRYRVKFPAAGSLPQSTAVYSEYQLRVIPRT